MMSLRLVACTGVLLHSTLAQAAPPAETAAPASRPVLRLDDAVSAALRNQPTIRQSRATADAAEGRATQARAGLFPQLNVTANYQHAYGNLGSRVTAGAAAGGGGAGTPLIPSGAPTRGEFDIYSFGATATQLLWDFGQVWNRQRAAGELATAAKQNAMASELTTIASVRQAYFQARAQKALIAVADETLANLERHRQQIEGFVRVGTRPDIDLAQARTDLANARVTLIQAKNNWAVARATLSQAMGVTATTDYDLADDELPPFPEEEQPLDKVYATALAARPELVAFEHQIEGQEHAVSAIKGAYGPTLNAVAGASEAGTSATGLQPSWNVGVTLIWPVFQGGLTTGQVHEAKANLDGLRAQVDAQKLQIRVDLERALLGVAAAKASEEAAGEVVTLARERLRLAEGRYASGVGSVLELGDAQVTLTNAEAQAITAHYNLLIARAGLLAALGRR